MRTLPRPPAHPTALLAALLCTLVLTGLTGCSDSGPQVPVATATATSTADATSISPTLSATASPTAPTEPPTFPTLATGTSDDAGAAFIKYYYAVVDYAQATGQFKELRHLGMPLCQACNQGLRGLQQVHAQGGSFEGGTHEVVSTRGGFVSESPDVAHYAYRVRLKITDQVVRTAPTATPTLYPASLLTVRFQLSRYNDTWRVESWEPTT